MAAASKVSWDDVVSVQENKDDCEDIKQVGVIGAGLVGCLAASILANRGYKVHMFEYRSDIRKEDIIQGRSINMTIAKRGLDSLDAIGVKDAILAESIPMHGRMIHRPDGSTYPVPYGVNDQAVYSISRNLINRLLLSKAEENKNVEINFMHKLTEVDLKKTEATFLQPDKTEIKRQFGALFSCEGAFSKTRGQFMRDTSFNYSQTYIDALYMELSMEPDENGNSKMPDVNYLHIWPRGHFMMIGLPNKDMSWTITLFGPKSIYQEFKTEAGVMAVFQKHFPDAIPLITKEKILQDCLRTDGYPMVSIKCSPHVLNKTMLLGDAAHAMVPFYGEGMNCGFEDCLVLNSLLEEHGMKGALSLYTGARVKDVQAMCDLSMYNYEEMRDLVRSPLFIARKFADNFLHAVVPRVWVPLYTSIRFQRSLTYKQCWDNKKWQDKIVDRALVCSALFVAGMALFLQTTMS